MPYQFAIKEVAGITKIKTIVSIFHKTKKRSLFFIY